MINMQTNSTKSRQALARIFKAIGATVSITAVLIAASVASAQDTISPPAIGQETKGTPAVIETTEDEKVASKSSSGNATASKPDNAGINSLLGTATVTESRRENGQVYLIELEHSSGSKQYIEENDSDGKIESTSNDIEETPNLPKWKIGSW